jgi:molybdate transport system substrate-binding protein
MRVRGRAGFSRSVLVVTGLVLSGLVLSGCIGSPPVAGPTGTVTVLAPTSLTEVLPIAVYRFTTFHSAVHIQLDFGPDGQHVAARTGDILVVEGPTALTPLGTAAGTPTVIARNQLVIGVAPNDPEGIAKAADLTRPALRVVLCAPAQPCGVSAAAALTAAGVTLTAPIYVDDTRAALDMVEKGTADAAFVYRSDVTAARDKAAAVEFPESSASLTAYQAVVLTKSDNADAARAFVSFLGTPDLLALLASAGLQAP